MMRTDERNRRVLAARTQYLETGEADGIRGLRPEVAASWKRSHFYSIDPTGVRPDYRKVNADRLSRAALPVIDRSLESLTGTATSLLFSDADGRLIGRWTDSSDLRRALNRSYVEAGFCMSEEVVGANGIGTALETGEVAEFRGAEHFAEQYLAFTCVGAPIRNPITRRIVGAIDITCRLQDTNSIARSWITALANQIEQQLLDDASTRERMLLSSFMATSRRTKRPVICISDRIVISSPAASSLAAELDQIVLWEAAQRVCRAASNGTTSLLLPNGSSVRIRCRGVRDEGRLVGAVLEIDTNVDLREPHAGSTSHLQPPGSATASSTRPQSTERPDRGLPGLAGRSERWSTLCAAAQRAKASTEGIVVIGEPGSGKLALVRAMFGDGPGDLTVVDCSLEPLDGPGAWIRTVRDHFRQPGGPLVLSHLEALSLPSARTVCALIDSNPAGARRVIATVTSGEQPHRPLVDRVGVIRLDVPPLRDRREDIPDLIAFLAERHATSPFGQKWLADALGAMARQRWTGNVRELESVVRRTLNATAGGPIGLGDLPEEIRSSNGPRRTLTRLEHLERQEIIDALVAENGNKVRTAQRLQFARSTLYRKISALGIENW